VLASAPCRAAVELIVLAMLTSSAGRAPASQNVGNENRHAQTTFDVRDYGAIGEGKTMDPAAIAEAAKNHDLRDT
jgi:hypothetical protein